MVTTGIRELKNNLSRFVRRVERGERIAVTAHGRVVAELGPPAVQGRASVSSRIATLIQEGVIRAPLESGDPLAGLPTIRLERGTAARLLEADRDGT